VAERKAAAFLQLSESPFEAILSVLRPRCSQLTYSANTQCVVVVPWRMNCGLHKEPRLPLREKGTPETRRKV
jgi:hypothetical protein